MKKVFSVLLVLVLVLGTCTSVVFADEILPEDPDFEVEFMAAPAVAGLILEEAGIDNRYGKGKDGGNFIKDVAAEMSNGAVFPAYAWDGSWDGVTYIEKCDEEAYYRAVYNYLAMKTGQLYVGLTTLVVTVPVDSYACAPIMAEGGTFPTAQVVDQHGQPVAGVKVGISLISVVDMQVVTTDENGYAVFDNAVYNVPDDYTVRYWVYDTDLRNPPYSNPIAGDITLSQKLDPVASNVSFVNNGDSTGTMTITVLDLCGNGIEGLGMDDFIIYDKNLVPYPPQGYQSLTYMENHGYWSVALTELGNGIYEVDFRRDGSMSFTREWGVLVVDELIDTVNVVFAYGPVVDTVSVPAYSSSVSEPVVINSNIILEAGVEYCLKVSGTANAGDTIDFDAEYSITNKIDGDVWTESVSGYTDYGTELLDLYVNGAPVNWGPYSRYHIYEHNIVGNGTTVSFFIDDIYCTNNSGALTVEIIQLP